MLALAVLLSFLGLWESWASSRCHFFLWSWPIPTLKLWRRGRKDSDLVIICGWWMQGIWWQCLVSIPVPSSPVCSPYSLLLSYLQGAPFGTCELFFSGRGGKGEGRAFFFFHDTDPWNSLNFRVCIECIFCSVSALLLFKLCHQIYLGVTQRYANQSSTQDIAATPSWNENMFMWWKPLREAYVLSNVCAALHVWLAKNKFRELCSFFPGSFWRVITVGH